MICLFCKKDSTSSRSVEHIIPESLGNTRLTLPPGVVCDSCNNYFARKVEKPLLDSADVSALRFHEAIPSKRKRIPPLAGFLGANAPVPVTVTRHLEGPFVGSIDVSPEAFTALMANNSSVIVLPGSSDAWPEDYASRFLAKAALEYMAFKLVADPAGLHYLATEPQFDPVRDYARRGSRAGWPYHSRRIYHSQKMWEELDGSEVQRVWECDILHTAHGEYYFITAIFGLELAINYGGPDIRGYTEWLEYHGGASPLCCGRSGGTEASDSVGIPLI